MERKTIKVSRKKLTWLIIILVIFGIWWANQPRYGGVMPMIGGYGVAEDSATRSVSPASAPMMDSSGAEMMYYPPDYYRGNPDITDTRQFLKTSYSADIKTRNVKEMIRDVRNIVRDAEGRIDNTQESEKYAYLGFVVAKDKFEAFRDEVESLTYAKLIVINVSSENLLGQKQSIEEQMENAKTSLTDLEKQKTSLTYKHNQTAANLNAQLIALQNQGTSTDAQQAVIRQSIANENSSYNSQLTSLNSRIDETKKWITSVEKQDVDFGNNIETVNGYISVSWASYWEMAKLLSPIHPGWIIAILVLIATQVLKRTGYLPKIELV